MTSRAWALAACAALLLGCGQPPDTGRRADEWPQPPGPAPFDPTHRNPRDVRPTTNVRLTALALSADGSLALTGHTAEFSDYSGEDPGEYNTAKLWDTARPEKPLQVFKGFDGGVWMAAFYPDGKRILLAAGSALRAYDLDSGKLVWWAAVDRSDVRAAALSPDGRLALTFGYDVTEGTMNVTVRGVLKVYSAAGGKLLQRFENKRFPPGEGGDLLHSVFLSPDGKLASVEGSIVDVDTGEVLLASARPLAFSPDSRQYIRPSKDGIDPAARRYHLTLSDARTGKDVRPFRPATEVEKDHTYPYAATFTWDGDYLVSVNQDGWLRRWEVASGKQLWSVDMGRWAGNNFAFSADGRRLLSWTGKEEARGDRDYHLSLWDTTDGKLLKAAPPFKDE